MKVFINDLMIKFIAFKLKKMGLIRVQNRRMITDKYFLMYV